MPTILDVAKHAGVSVATVSRTINNRGPISEKTRKKVFKSVKELEYYPNEMARSLQRRKSHIIGLIVPMIDYSFFSRLIEAIEETCQDKGYKLMLCKTGADEKREKELVSMLQSNKVDGILLSSRVGDTSIYTKYKLPIVSIDRDIKNVPSVTSDNYYGGVLAARALFQVGCRQVLLFGGDVPEYMPMYLRNRGFFEECEKNNVKCLEYVIKEHEILQKKVPADLLHFFKINPQIDGMFVNGDLLAAQLIHALEEEGIDILGNIPVVGFDDIEISDIIGLTTIAQPIWEMGECAVNLLFKKIEGERVPALSVLPVKLIERKSTLSKTKVKSTE